MKGLLDVRLPEIGSRQSLRGSAPSCGRYARRRRALEQLCVRFCGWDHLLAKKKIAVLSSKLKKRDRAELLALRSHAPSWLASELSQAFQP